MSNRFCSNWKRLKKQAKVKKKKKREKTKGKFINKDSIKERRYFVIELNLCWDLNQLKVTIFEKKERRRTRRKYEDRGLLCISRIFHRCHECEEKKASIQELHLNFESLSLAPRKTEKLSSYTHPLSLGRLVCEKRGKIFTRFGLETLKHTHWNPVFTEKSTFSWGDWKVVKYRLRWNIDSGVRIVCHPTDEEKGKKSSHWIRVEKKCYQCFTY